MYKHIHIHTHLNVCKVKRDQTGGKSCWKSVLVGERKKLSNETWKSKRKWVVIKIEDGVVRNKGNEGKNTT